MTEKSQKVDPEKREEMLEQVQEYVARLIDSGFSGRVTLRFDRGILQREVKKDETEKLE